jgi:hypothetical protein
MTPTMYRSYASVKNLLGVRVSRMGAGTGEGRRQGCGGRAWEVAEAGYPQAETGRRKSRRLVRMKAGTAGAAHSQLVGTPAAAWLVCLLPDRPATADHCRLLLSGTHPTPEMRMALTWNQEKEACDEL